MRGPTLVLTPLLALSLGGCLAKTALDVVTAPVKIAGKAVDMATTSQSEADEKRGRELRRREAELGKLQKNYETQLERCREGDQRACNASQNTYAQIQLLLPTVPVEPPPR